MTIVIDPQVAGASGTGLDGLVARVRRELQERDNINLLSSGIDSLTTELVMSYPLGTLTRGTLVSVDDETMHVWEADPNTRTVTVLRGYAGTTATAHDPSSIINYGGKSRKMIVDAINDEIRSVHAKGLYQMKSMTVPNYNSGQWAYSLADLDKSVLYDVQWLVPGQNADWIHLRGWSFNSIDSTVVFENMPFYGGSQVRVLYKAGFDPLVNGDDDVQGVAGLQSEAADVLVWGAAARLTAPDEYARNNIHGQGDTRRPSEVPPGAVGRSAAAFKQMRDERLSEEKDRLRRRFPERKAGW